MRKIYDKKYIKNILETKGYTIIGEIKSANDKVLCLNEDGYKVMACPIGIIKRNDSPDIF